jgi:hypothetical protein
MGLRLQREYAEYRIFTGYIQNEIPDSRFLDSKPLKWTKNQFKCEYK